MYTLDITKITSLELCQSFFIPYKHTHINKYFDKMDGGLGRFNSHLQFLLGHLKE